MLVLYCEEKWLKCTSKKCAGLIFSGSWCLFKRDIGDILSLKRWLAEEVFWSEVLFFFSRLACSWYVYLLDTRFLSFRVLALFSSFLVGLASADTCICLSEGARWIGLFLSPFLSSFFFFSMFFSSLVCGLVLCFVLPQCSRGRKLREVPGFSITCKRELLCHGQGLARPLLPSAVVRRNSTAINCHSLLMFTSVLSGTLVTGSCSEEHLRSKDSFTYWHPWSR